MDYKTLEDYALILECIKGDNEAFGELVARYKNLVYSVIYRMVNDPEEAKDLFQEVFIKVYKNLQKYSPDYKFSTWIMRITTNHVIDYRRKKRLETVDLDEAVATKSVKDTPEDLYIKKEQMSNVQKALNALPDNYRIPMVLYHKQGLSYQEISDIIKEPMSKVKNRIFRARRMLKEQLISEGR